MWDIENNVSIGAKPEEGRNNSSVSNQPSNIGTMFQRATHLDLVPGEDVAAKNAKEKLTKLIAKSTKGCPLFGQCWGMNGNGPYGAYYGKRRTGWFIFNNAFVVKFGRISMCLSTATQPVCRHRFLFKFMKTGMYNMHLDNTS